MGMLFTDAELQEYKEIWREEFQESISVDEARHSASMLMELLALLLEQTPGASSPTSENLLPDHRT
jgi:hypothetical protein